MYVLISKAYNRVKRIQENQRKPCYYQRLLHHLELLAGYVNSGQFLSNTFVKRDEYEIRNKDNHEK